MENITERIQLLEKLFDQAVRMKLSQLARKNDPDLIFKLWTQIVKIDEIKTYFRKWVWKPDLTITEALDCLDDYCSGLEVLLRKRQGKENNFGATVA